MKAAVDKFEAQDGRIQKFFEKTGCMLAVDKHTDDRIDLEGLDTTYDYHKMGPAAGAVVMISESSSEDEDEDEDTSAAGATAASTSTSAAGATTTGATGIDHGDGDDEDREDGIPALSHVNGDDPLGAGDLTDVNATPVEVAANYTDDLHLTWYFIYSRSKPNDYLDPPELVAFATALSTTWTVQAREPADGCKPGMYIVKWFEGGGWEVGRLVKAKRLMSNREWWVKFPGDTRTWLVKASPATYFMAEDLEQGEEGAVEPNEGRWAVVRVVRA